jgi:membrane protein required for beta-lactamase induction
MDMLISLIRIVVARAAILAVSALIMKREVQTGGRGISFGVFLLLRVHVIIAHVGQRDIRGQYGAAHQFE